MQVFSSDEEEVGDLGAKQEKESKMKKRSQMLAEMRSHLSTGELGLLHPHRCTLPFDIFGSTS